MSEIEFLHFGEANPEEFRAVLNEDSLRTHLIDHPYFDITRFQSWRDDKIQLDSLPGCRVRAVYIDGALAGWCGIQPDDRGHEIAIVISKKFWGFGIAIFRHIMCWAKELGHKEILFHLLDSRPEYKALNKMASKVQKTELAGRCFTTYYLSLVD